MLTTFYNGFCVDPYERLKKQQGKVVGGAETVARQRRRGANVQFRFLIGGFPDKRNAKQFEWKQRYLRVKRVRSPSQKLQWLKDLSTKGADFRWTRTAKSLGQLGRPVTIWSFDPDEELPASSALVVFRRAESLEALAG